MYLGGTSGRCVRNLMHMIAPTRKCHVRAYAPFLADTSAQMLVRTYWVQHESGRDRTFRCAGAAVPSERTGPGRSGGGSRPLEGAATARRVRTLTATVWCWCLSSHRFVAPSVAGAGEAIRTLCDCSQ